MRATANRSPIPMGKRRLLESCAIAAGLIALAHGGPAMAQVAGTGTIVTGGAGSTIVNNGGTNTTAVTVTGNQSIINWVPTDNAPDGGAIDFLPTGENLTFSGAGNYTVLNRFTNGTGGSLSRQIALNGTVQSYDTTIPVAAGAATGGNIWFYNAGGVLIGANATINVGSLVLTANDIDTTGGLYGAGGEIRFRGAAGSTSSVEIAPGAVINADKGFAGSSYVAFVAPRIVQGGRVGVNGSAAYVAAEQADVRINTGLFDINVLVGAEGGNAITHTGVTTGPEQQAAGNAQRIYMVAVPKNDAVTMLVSGQVGYQDALVATQTDSEGSVVLSAGYNVTGGAIDTTPVNATPADLTINDIIFRSSVTAHASGDFVGQPLLSLPAVGGPVTSLPPAHFGRFVIQGDGDFTGDASATLTVNANRFGGITGDLTVRSGGTGGDSGSTAVNILGGLQVGGDLSLVATGPVDAVTGASVGGDASLAITGGIVTATNVFVDASGTGGIGAAGDGGAGTGGNASIDVSNPGGSLTADTISLSANGVGGGLIDDPDFGIIASDVGGAGAGGSATLSVTNGSSLTANDSIFVNADGSGQTGNVQSGTATGGTAQLTISGESVTFASPTTNVSAAAFGGSNFALPGGPLYTARGGDATGGTATLTISADAASNVAAGSTVVSADVGGGASGGSENGRGGDAQGGNASVSVDNGVTANFTRLAVTADAGSGGGTSPSGTTSLSGDAQGGSASITATNASSIASSGDIDLEANGTVGVSDSFGSGTGGTITVNPTAGATITAAGEFIAQATGGSSTSIQAFNTGGGTGGDISFNADGGTISAGSYTVSAGASTNNVTGTGGAAQGGTLDLLASNGGRIESTDQSGFNRFAADAQSGASSGGAEAVGGDIQVIANAGTIAIAGFTGLSAGGVSGGDRDFGNGPAVYGRGGSLLVRTVAETSDSSAVSFDSLSANADGASYVDVEGSSGLDDRGSANGQGGSISIDIQGGSFSVNSGSFNAGGTGGALGPGRGVGFGGIVDYTQTGGDVTVGDLFVGADGYGGYGQGQSGDGFGGTVTMNLLGGTLTGGQVSVSADGNGEYGSFGDDFDAPDIVEAGDGGNGEGGTATINIDGSVVVETSLLTASAGGYGGYGGDFSSFGNSGGDGGQGGSGQGGTANINVNGGSLTTGDLVADAGGYGGYGGSFYFSSSSGSPTGTGVGGNGGAGQGGTATINLRQNVDSANTVASYARGVGGAGGYDTTGGDGGAATGGLAQAIVTNYDAGTLAVTVDTTATGGNGGSGTGGDGGNGGDATGGIARVQADGPDGAVSVSQANFVTGATGGNGGTAFNDFYAETMPVGAKGGNGGFATGGTLEIIANSGSSISLEPDTSGVVTLGSIGTGGNGGNGADNTGLIYSPGPDGIIDTADDTSVGVTGGDGGIGGGGTGGTVHILANGGTVTSNDGAVDISVSGVSGTGGSGGAGSLVGGSGNSSFIDIGGHVLIEALADAEGPGQIAFGDTTIAANGFSAGRIEMRTDGNITLASLGAEVLGASSPTNNDTDVAPQGIFLATTAGTITVDGDASFETDSSVGLYAQGDGQLNAGGDITIDAGDQVDIRHEYRDGATNPTIISGGNTTITAVSGISGALGTQINATNTLTLTAGNPNGVIGVDHLAATDIVMSSGRSTNVEHAEADNDFTATAGSFRTGLNSIITGGDIEITSPGAIDLGNATAGGYIFAAGQTIGFNTLDAGAYVDLNTTGTGTGTGGIGGGTILAGSDIFLAANDIDVGAIEGAGSLFATATGGAFAVDDADVVGLIGVTAAGNITGSYSAGGDIRLSSGADIDATANAAGGFPDPENADVPTAGNVFLEAGGDVTLADSAAAGDLGIAGNQITLTNVSAGEDMLVVAQTTANLTGISAGDDIDVGAPGAIIVNGASATGAGPDGLTLAYSPNGGFTIGQGEGSTSLDGADISIASSNASIDASGLSAGDDIFLNAATTLAVNGATTLGLGVTAGASNIQTQSGDATLANLDAFDDIDVDSTGGVNVSGPASAGRNVTIDADSVTLADLATPAGQVIDTLAAGGNIAITAASDISGGRIVAGGNLALIAGNVIDISFAETGDGGVMTLDGAEGVTADTLYSRGETYLTANDGDIQVNSLNSSGNVDVAAQSLNISTNGPIEFANIVTTVGDASIRSNNRFIVDDATIAGTARFINDGEHMIINGLTATAADFDANEMLSMTNVSVTGAFNADAGATILVDGTVTGTNISLASGDITITQAGRVGTAGMTQALSVQNNDNERQTFVGGTGTVNGYQIDADELTRLYGSNVEVFAPEVEVANAASVGSAAPPDVIVDGFTMTGGTATSNLGANGSLTIRTPGKMRVIGGVQLTGLTDNNALNLFADDALEVILGQGSVRLLNGSNPAGRLNLQSDDVIVATQAAIADVGTATTTDAIESRLAQNDGVALDDGALYAGGINFSVINGAYVQNSGAGTDFDQRRGLTFGALGLNVDTEGSGTRIVLNGVQLGPNGQVTGLDTIPALTVGGSTPSAGNFDPRSTLNGCLIGNVASCSFVPPPPPPEYETDFPVQDVIEDQVDDDGDDGDGISLPTALITMRDLDPLSGAPLLDDPVTGAGNDDLWTPPTE